MKQTYPDLWIDDAPPAASAPSNNGDGWLRPAARNDDRPAPLSAADLLAASPALNPPVIHELLRECETMNVIAASKTGKSWLIHDLLLSVATGAPWLGKFEVKRGPVLLIDNELHPSTLASRIARVAEARGINLAAVGPNLQVEVLRGRLKNLWTMKSYFDAIEPERYRLIALDAFYRFLPPGTNENDNGAMADLYNTIDAHAQRIRCAFALVHHSSKGNQSEKTVTDTGSGAGAMSRAVDAHFVLRAHAEDGAVVADAAVRSWPPMTPFCLRWQFPTWQVAPELDPANLRRPASRRRQKEEETDEKAPPKPTMTPEGFVAAFVGREPQTKAVILGRAALAGVTGRKAEALLALAVAGKLAHRWPAARRNEPAQFSTAEPSLLNQAEVKP